MKSHCCILLLLFFFLNAATAQDAKTSFQELTSIQGTWRMETKRGPVQETWLLINDSTLAGKSYRLMNGTDTMLLEQVQLLRKGNAVYYIPTVQGQNNEQPVRFTLTSFINNVFTFENPSHDFPQRVLYELPVNDTMHAWIDGMDKGVFRKTDFRYKKVK